MNALNLDTLAFLLDRMLPGTNFPLNEVPKGYWRLPFIRVKGGVVDLVCVVDELVNDEFGGTAL